MNQRSVDGNRRRRRGPGALLPAILAALAMTATAFGVAHAMRGIREKQASSRPAVTAVPSAWEEAESVRRFLEGADENTLAGLAGGRSLGGAHGVSARIVNVVQDRDGASRDAYRVTADIDAAAGKPPIQVVYEVAPAPGGDAPGGGRKPTLIDTINIYEDLDLTGGIKVLGDARANLNVAGNVSLDSASIEGIDTLRATGSVSVGSGVHVGRIYANGAVTVTGAASADLIDALGDVIIDGGARPFAIRSNGAVIFNGGSASSVSAIGDVVVAAVGVSVASIDTMGSVRWTGSGGSAGSIRANGNVLYAGSNRGTSIRAIGDVTLTGSGAERVATRGNVALEGFGSIGEVAAQGDLGVHSWGGVNGRIGGRLRKSESLMPARIVSQPGLETGVAPVAIAALSPVTIERPAIDAYALKASANYAFEKLDGAIRVTVSHVAGIDGGTYFLGWYTQTHGRGYRIGLCTRLVPGTLTGDGKGRCAGPAMPSGAICQALSGRRDCLAYRDGVWRLRGKRFARGVLWFHGDLSLSGGNGPITAIATGDIAVAGGLRVDAPNYAGYEAMCANATPAGQQRTPDIARAHPVEFCDTARQRLHDHPLGNVALLAGGYADGAFSGGDISIGASAVVNGSVIAGNTIRTGGGTAINGYLTAARNKRDAAPVSLRGMTLLDYRKLPSTYQPGSVPCMRDCTPGARTAGADAGRIAGTGNL